MSLSDLSKAKKEYQCYDCKQAININDDYIRLARGDELVTVRGAWNQQNPTFKQKHPICKGCYLREYPLSKEDSKIVPFEEGKYYSYLYTDDVFPTEQAKDGLIISRMFYVAELYAKNIHTEAEKRIKNDKDYIGSKKYETFYVDVNGYGVDHNRYICFEVTDKGMIESFLGVRQERENYEDYMSDLYDASLA